MKEAVVMGAEQHPLFDKQGVGFTAKPLFRGTPKEAHKHAKSLRKQGITCNVFKVPTMGTDRRKDNSPMADKAVINEKSTQPYIKTRAGFKKLDRVEGFTRLGTRKGGSISINGSKAGIRKRKRTVMIIAVHTALRKLSQALQQADAAGESQYLKQSAINSLKEDGLEAIQSDLTTLAREHFYGLKMPSENRPSQYRHLTQAKGYGWRRELEDFLLKYVYKKHLNDFLIPV